MRRHQKWLVLVTLVLVTHLAVRGLIALAANGPFSAELVEPVSDRESLTPGRQVLGPVPIRSMADTPSVRGSRGVALNHVMSLDDGTVLFAGRARVYERDAAGAFAWRVRLLDESAEMVYFDPPFPGEPFWITPRTEHLVDVVDTLPIRLPPGAYCLELSLTDLLADPRSPCLALSRRTFVVK